MRSINPTGFYLDSAIVRSMLGGLLAGLVCEIHILGAKGPSTANQQYSESNLILGSIPRCSL